MVTVPVTVRMGAGDGDAAGQEIGVAPAAAQYPSASHKETQAMSASHAALVEMDVHADP